MRRHHLAATLLFFAAYLKLNHQLTKLLVIALQEVADESDEGSPEDDHQADEDLKLILAEFHCIPILGFGQTLGNSRNLPN